MSDGTDAAAILAREWREARAAVLELAATIPETRVYRGMERAGWTLKHELAHLAALDAEVRHLLAASSDDLQGALDPVRLRRLRGEAMHHAQGLRLAPLREHLAGAGEETARAIEALGDAAEAAQEAALDLVRARLGRAREGVQALRSALGQ